MSRGGVRPGKLFGLVLVIAGIFAGCVISAGLWAVVVRASPRYMVPNLVSQIELFRWWLYPRFFVRQGDLYISNHPSMPYRELPVTKAAGTFRVFLTGSSQAMGDPYVHVWPERTKAQQLRLRIEDRGGISTWLRQYLQMLHPDRNVEVHNVAIAGQNVSTVAREVIEILQIGEPDLIIVLSGNNEWRGAEISPDRFDETIAVVVDRYAADLRRIAVAAEAARVPTYMLTVPVNLRDWVPSMYPLELRGAMREIFGKRDWERGLRVLEQVGATQHALYSFVRARAREATGDMPGAFDAYVLARDRDPAVIRTVSALNDVVRGLDGTYVRSFDLEKALRHYARDGIPGFDLFHDFCHMKLRGYMLAAKEIALFHQKIQGMPTQPLPDLDVPDQIRESLRVLYAVKERKWADLAGIKGVARLGEMNIENVSEGFRAEQRELDDLQRAIHQYESDLGEGKDAGTPGQLTQVECDGGAADADCHVAHD
jgi:hypothetical protein